MSLFTVFSETLLKRSGLSSRTTFRDFSSTPKYFAKIQRPIAPYPTGPPSTLYQAVTTSNNVNNNNNKKTQDDREKEFVAKILSPSSKFIQIPIQQAHTYSNATLPSSSEPIATKRSRLLMQSRNRGLQELSSLLTYFAREQLSKMSNKELEEFDVLINQNSDILLYGWLLAKADMPAKLRNMVVTRKLFEFIERRKMEISKKQASNSGEGKRRL